MLRVPHRAVLSLTGPDTLALLERTVTHPVADWPEGEARYGALLTPQGKVIADYIAVRTPDGVRLDVHADAADDLVKRLKLFRLRADIEISVLGDLCVNVTDPLTGSHADPRSPNLPHRIFSAIHDGPAAGDWDALAIRAGVPEWGRDYRASDVFPTDINMDQMSGIDYRKGCFVGQEVASRMKRKGGIRKRTLRVSGSGVAVGAEIIAGTSIGAVTSAAGPDGLALIRIDRLAAQSLAGGDMLCNGQPVRILTDPGDWATQEIGAHFVD